MISPSDLDRALRPDDKTEHCRTNTKEEIDASLTGHAVKPAMLSKEEIILKNSLSLLDPIEIHGIICLAVSFNDRLEFQADKSAAYTGGNKTSLIKKFTQAFSAKAFESLSEDISTPFLAKLWTDQCSTENGESRSYILTKTFGPYGLIGYFLLEMKKVDASINDSVLEHAQHITQSAFSKMAVLGTKFVQETRLTPREKDIVRWIARGKSNMEIAKLMDISIHTVNGYLRAIYLKTNTAERVSASFYALRHGLLDVRPHT